MSEKVDFDDIAREHKQLIVKETLTSLHDFTERGMIFVEEDGTHGKTRLYTKRTWFGTPTRLIVPIPQDKKTIILHTHIGNTLFSWEDVANLQERGIEWVCVSSVVHGKVVMRGIKVSSLGNRFVPVVFAWLENNLNYKYGIPPGPRVEIKEEVLQEVGK